MSERRKARAVPADQGDAMPEPLRHFRSEEWPVPPPSTDDWDDDAQHVRNNPTDRPGTQVAIMQHWRARSAWKDARRAWCRERGLIDAQGRPTRRE